MGKSSKVPAQIVGQSLYANIAMAVGSKVDKYLELWIDSDKISNLDNISRDAFVMTGEKSEQYPSNSGKSKLKFYYGNNKIANDLLTKLTGYAIKYKNTAYVVFYDAFIGDNVRSVPNYRFKVRRTNLLGWYKDGVLLDDINGEINPAIALYYIMTELSKVPEELIDKNSFVKSAIDLYDEAFGLSFNISTSEEAKKWSSEILRMIDGSLFFDIKNGKYILKLLRDDYNVNTLISLNDTNTKDVKYTKNTWANTDTEVTLEYTSSSNFKAISINKTNTTTEILSGNQKNKVVKMMAITNDVVANNVLNRQLQKYTLPLASITMKIPSNIYLRPLDVIKYSNKTIGISNMLLRVLEIGADGYEKEYYEIKCIEDIFSLGEFDVSDVQQPIAEYNDYIINNNMELIYNNIFLPRSLTKYTNIPSMLFLDNANDNSVVTYDTITHNNNNYTQQVENYSYLLSNIENNNKYFIEDIIIQRQNWMEEFVLSEMDWQNLEKIIVINKEILSYKELTFIDDNSVKISKILRNVNNMDSIIKYSVSDRIWFLSNNYKTIEVEKLIDNQVNLDVKLNNRKNVSNNFKVKIDYEDIYNIPEPVEFIQYSNNTLTWLPTYWEKYTSSATYSNPDDLIPRIYNESIVETDQSFKLEVIYNNNQQETIYTNKLSYDIPSLKSVLIYNIINNKESEPIEFIS